MDRIAHPWGERTPYGRGERWPERVDEHVEGDVRWVPSASILHSNGDALDIGVRDGRIAGVRGIARSRVNRGRLGVKDLYGWQANGSRDRLTEPLIRRSGALQPASWDEAMELIVERSRALPADAVGFYTSGQLFLEEYYALAMIARAGIGTSHIDGNTRLCTATAGESLKESFGADGQPGSYADVDDADAIVLYGHNAAATQEVLWMRILDRLAGPEPPTVVCIDPRDTPVAEHADLHLAPRVGTNLALLNALVHEVIANGWVDTTYVGTHTVGFDALERTVATCTPEWAAAICDVDAGLIRAAARVIGTAERLLQTVLQGVYQSHQATAAACQVNNLALLRGQLHVLQMNGQPTAQNTRETGANGDLPGFRNWANEAHVEDLARVWNVEPDTIPHDGPSTPAMQIFELAAKGDIRFLWISATNPAVSLPELSRIRSLMEKPFLVVQDIFETETTALADVVLPAATWGEKLGTFTNADRTVHISEKAVDPPGEARPDLDIFLDYARRMDFRDRDGAPLIRWHDPETAFEAWKDCARGRPCSYDGITYAVLRESAGTQWGGERLYGDGRFPAAPEESETFCRDLSSGEEWGEERYRAFNPEGRAMLRTAEYAPPPEMPSDEYPLLLTTGRSIYHFHTRTKTARAPELQTAEPEVWVELSAPDAAARGLSADDVAEIRSARGVVHAHVRIGGIREGVVFVPFHYGYWDAGGTFDRAANELTLTHVDPVSKQPMFKVAAVQVQGRSAREVPSTAPAASSARTAT
jgi:anaerobic selenocysteine-containing dehydrogenase